MRDGVSTLLCEAPPATRAPWQLIAQPLWAAAPIVVVAVLLLLTARAEYYKHGYQGLVGFATIGSNYGERIGIHKGAVSDVGYDGQFYYYLALDPGLIGACARGSAGCPLDNQPLVREERILYPMTARLLAFGQPALTPLALLLVNFLAILITALLLGQLCAGAAGQAGARWLGAAAALYCGETLAFARDLADPYAGMWLVLALWLARRDRYLLAALAGAAMALTREQLLFMLPLLALPLLLHRRWQDLGLFAAVSLAPVLAWQLVLHSLYGVWPILHGDSRAASLDVVPFLGLWQQRHAGDFKLEVVAVALPLVVTMALAVVSLRRAGLRAALQNPVALIALLYSLLVSLIAALQWVDLSAPSRLTIEAVAPGAIVASRLRPWLRIAYGVLLAGTTLALLAGNIPYIFGAHPHVLR